MQNYSRKANNKGYTLFFCIFEKLCLNNTKITHDALVQSCFPEFLLLLVCPYEEKGLNCGSLIFVLHCSIPEMVLLTQCRHSSGPRGSERR